MALIATIIPTRGAIIAIKMMCDDRPRHFTTGLDFTTDWRLGNDLPTKWRPSLLDECAVVHVEATLLCSRFG
ncbi:hypothetical protein Y032_0194g1421 [Ancylostoma ceylanicum]|uniref:Uncharacterized protein n=1 Tax=Ancylostoma ceylanicum TaxID=53326 RepID=A0A016SNV8_9BILA|nr:hypothetical protein Y032_0194g1421 [Ancylostoma ceylanicum]